MKKLLTAAAASVFLTASAFASVKIGVIDIPQIMQNSPQVKTINKRLQDKFRPQQQKIVAAQTEVRTQAAKLAPNAATKLTDEQKKAIQAKVTASQKQLQTMVMNFQRSLSQAQAEAMKNFLNEVNSTVKTIATKQNLEVVLLKPALVYAQDKKDITSEVLAALPAK